MYRAAMGSKLKRLISQPQRSDRNLNASVVESGIRRSESEHQASCIRGTPGRTRGVGKPHRCTHQHPRSTKVGPAEAIAIDHVENVPLSAIASRPCISDGVI